MAEAKGCKKKRAKDRPTFNAYWAWDGRRLRKRKVRNLVRYCGLSVEAAMKLWDGLTASRKQRSRGAAVLL